ncbi:MAG: hypothetical protein K2J75_04725, partial [Clostridia bacterium]|nr:hypothetical protein [Clostridia bacterium]
MNFSKKFNKGFCLTISILILLCITFCCFALSVCSNEIAEAIANKVSIGTDLLHNNYTKVADGKYFNADVLSSLYEYLAGTGATYKTVELLSQSPKTGTNAISNGIDSADIRGNNDGKDLVIKFGGLNWIVTSLTTDMSGNTILTLWLESSTYTSKWSNITGSSFTATYPTSVYSSSLIRAKLLNGKSFDNSGTRAAVKYVNTVNSSTLVPYTADPNYPFKVFTETVAENPNSIINYLIQPKAVEYQHTQDHRKCGWTPTREPNEALDIFSDGWNAAGTIGVQNSPVYSDWGNDYIWLPSITETGFTHNNASTEYIGLWNTLPSTRSSSADTALRTGDDNDGGWIWHMTADGRVYWGKTNEFTYTLRPAIHLNLTKAEQDSIRVLSVPDQLTSTYNTSEQTIVDADEIADKSWYDSALYGDTSKIKIEYLDSKGTLLQGRTPKDADTYTVRYTLLDKANYAWLDSSLTSDNVRTATFVIRKKQVEFPKFFNNESSKVYDGGSNITFTVANYDKDALKIEYNGSEIPANNKVTATDFGDYQLDVSLRDSKNYVLNSTATKMDFHVTKFEIEIKLSDITSGSSALTIISETDKIFNLEVAVGKGVHENSDNPITVPITIIANEVTGSLQPANVGKVTLTSSDTLKTLTLSAADLVNTSYTLSASTTNPNYEVKINPTATLEVSDTSSGTAVRWQLYADNVPVSGQYKNAEIGETSVTLSKNITYDGRQYTFRVTCPTGYEMDNNFGVSGFEVIPTNTANSAVGKNSDTYKTRISLKEIATGVKTEYEIIWEIEKAKFDLSAVKWKYDGKIPFSTVSMEMKAEIDADTLPKGLKVNLPYIGINSGNKVGDKDTATVSFAFDTSDPNYALNYILPVQGDKTTYDFTPSGSLNDFEWSKYWEIVKLQIALNWKLEEVTDVNGEKYQRQTLVDDKRVVEYEYYLWDTATNQPVGNALSEADIEVEENVSKHYVTKAVIKSIYQNDVEFNSSNLYSQPFTVGVNATAVEVTLVSNTLTYNGNAQAVRLRISGALSESDFDIVYYDKDGTTPLDGAPKNAGQYRVEISLKSSVTGFYLDGANVTDGVAVIEYEIKPMSIDGSEGNWTDVRKPPSLQINKKELAGIEYEYTDMDGNTLKFSDLKAGNTYKIRAVIKDKTNYAFADGTYETAWKEFSVSANEVMVDPSDPNAYPDAPDDPNNPDDNSPSGNDPSGNNPSGDGGTLDEILEKLKEIPLWQIITGVISIILTIIFLSKTASYDSKRRKYNKKADKLDTSMYAGAFLGVAMTIWTAIACVLMGLAVVSFVMMLIAKSRCNKAEDNYEEMFE